MLQYSKEYITNADNIYQILQDAKPEWEKEKNYIK